MYFQLIMSFLPKLFRILVIVVPIVISMLTLHQNSKMIEESTRAYVTIYLASYIINQKNYVLIIKNFGKTGAVINSVICNKDLSEISYIQYAKPFSSMENMYIAPNQFFYCAVNCEKFTKINSADFTISYSTTTRTYTETISVNFCFDANDTYTQTPSPRNDDCLKNISFSLEELLRQNL